MKPFRQDGEVCIRKLNSQEDMGFTAAAMEKSFASLGFRTVFSRKVLHCVKAGEVASSADILCEAERSGLELKKTMKLQRV